MAEPLFLAAAGVTGGNRERDEADGHRGVDRDAVVAAVRLPLGGERVHIGAVDEVEGGERRQERQELRLARRRARAHSAGH